MPVVDPRRHWAFDAVAVSNAVVPGTAQVGGRADQRVRHILPCRRQARRRPTHGGVLNLNPKSSRTTTADPGSSDIAPCHSQRDETGRRLRRSRDTRRLARDRATSSQTHSLGEGGREGRCRASRPRPCSLFQAPSASRRRHKAAAPLSSPRSHPRSIRNGPYARSSTILIGCRAACTNHIRHIASAGKGANWKGERPMPTSRAARHGAQQSHAPPLLLGLLPHPLTLGGAGRTSRPPRRR